MHEINKKHTENNIVFKLLAKLREDELKFKNDTLYLLQDKTKSLIFRIHLGLQYHTNISYVLFYQQ